MVIPVEDLDEDQSEAWLGAIEDGVFEEEKGLEEKCRAATAFAAKRRESRRWFTFSRSNPHDVLPLWRMETSRGPVHFEQGQGQQARPWDCSFVLTKYLDQHPEEIRGKGVLELGCGVGIPGVAAAVLGAEEVILTDMAAGLPSIERTIALNPSVASKLTGRVLPWGSRSETTELLLAARSPVTVVLCSDLLLAASGARCVYQEVSGGVERMGWMDVRDKSRVCFDAPVGVSPLSRFAHGAHLALLFFRDPMAFVSFASTTSLPVLGLTVLLPVLCSLPSSLTGRLLPRSI